MPCRFVSPRIPGTHAACCLSGSLPGGSLQHACCPEIWVFEPLCLRSLSRRYTSLSYKKWKISGLYFTGPSTPPSDDGYCDQRLNGRSPAMQKLKSELLLSEDVRP